MTDEDIDAKRMKGRGETELRRRSEKRLEVCVDGWGLTDTQIKALGNTNQKEIFWIPNALIPVSISALGFNANMLIASVVHEASVETLQSTLTLVKRERYL